MPKIVPIRDLKNTSEISELCHASDQPVFVTKNGYGDLVLMSMELYEKTAFMQEIFLKVEDGERDVAGGTTADAGEAVSVLRLRHDLQR